MKTGIRRGIRLCRITVQPYLLLVVLAGAGLAAEPPSGMSPDAEEEVLLRVRAVLDAFEAQPGADPDPFARRLAGLGPEALPILYFTLGETSHEFRGSGRKDLLERAFGFVPPETLNAFLRAKVFSEEGDATTRVMALRLLGASGRAASLTLVTEIAAELGEELRSPAVSGRLRGTAAAIFARDPAAFRRMPGAWTELPPLVREILLDAMESAGGREARVTLCRLLGTVLGVHDEAILGRLARTPVLAGGAWSRVERNTVIGCLGGEDPEVRRKAAFVVGRFHLAEAVDVLVSLLDERKEPDRDIRSASAWGLRRLSGATLLADAALWRQWLGSEREWLGSFRTTEVPGLRSGDPEAIAASLDSLARHRLFRDEFLDEILLVVRHEESAIRRAALETLARLGSPEALAPLFNGLRDEEDVREAAAAGLRSLTGLDAPADPAAWSKVLAKSGIGPAAIPR